MKIFGCVIISICTVFVTCKKGGKPESTTEPAVKYERDIFSFELVNAGDSPGSCGKIIFAEVDSGSNLTFFKSENLPAGIIASPSYKYKGKFEVLPQVYTCKDGRIEPRPGGEAHTKSYHLVNIISWERK